VENPIRFVERRVDTIVNILPQSPFGRRHSFDVVPLFVVATQCWRENGARSKIRVEQIVDSDLPRIWTHPESVFRIINRFVMDSIAASIEGGVVEVALRTADPDGDWAVFTVRDWAGGKPEGWMLDPSTQQLAKQIDGYIDIANHPGRGTVYSLYLPTGSLAGWLCRQSQSASGYFVSWDQNDLGTNVSKSESSRIDEAVQMSLLPLGSLVPSGDQAYLFSSSSPLDMASIEAAIADRFASIPSSPKSYQARSVRVEYIGPMGEFMRRLESSIPTSTCDLGWESLINEPGLITRVDPPIETPKLPLEVAKRPTLAAASGGRMRPRRATLI
jgi:hypothetical protein